MQHATRRSLHNTLMLLALHAARRSLHNTLMLLSLHAAALMQAAPSIMIGEKAASMILQEHGSGSSVL